MWQAPRERWLPERRNVPRRASACERSGACGKPRARRPPRARAASGSRWTRSTYEADLFEDALQRAGLLGHLADALVGLEVDPAMHVFGLKREEAVGMMMDLSGRPRAEAERYADRHASTPGQLATYMTGCLELMRLHEEARAALGERFDVREFHDVVLGDGPLPLPMLREKLRRWSQAKRP